MKKHEKYLHNKFLRHTKWLYTKHKNVETSSHINKKS